MHDKNAGLAVILTLLLLCTVLAMGCITERRGASPDQEKTLISPPDLPEPPPGTIAVPGAEDHPSPAVSWSVTGPG